MKLDMRIEGTKEITANLDRLDKDMVEKVKQSLTDSAKTIADRARDNAPKKSGLLKSAIKYKPAKSPKFPYVALAVVDRKKAPHAHLVEYGARGGAMPAHPYLRPAFDHLKREIEGKIKSVVESVVRRHA